MKNQIAKRVMNNAVVSKVFGEIGKFYVNHQSVILTGGTIGFSMATTAVAMRNAVKINDILYTARDALSQCDTKEEKNAVYKLFMKELVPLILPIVIFQAATIGCALVSKKQLDIKDKKLAEAAGALSIAQSAVAQYQAFAKEAETALGEKKYDKLQSDISKDMIVDGRRFSSVPSEGAPGEVLMISKYNGKPFWSTCEKCNVAAHELTVKLRSGYEIATVEGTPFDFRQEKTLGKDIEADNEQLKFVGGYDHNFVVDGADGSLKEFCCVSSPATGITMKCFTTLPGFQLYTGNYVKNVPGKEGAVYDFRHGFCLETQFYPNSVNEPSFPDCIFGPDREYDTVTVYQFV